MSLPQVWAIFLSLFLNCFPICRSFVMFLFCYVAFSLCHHYQVDNIPDALLYLFNYFTISLFRTSTQMISCLWILILIEVVLVVLVVLVLVVVVLVVVVVVVVMVMVMVVV